MRLAKRAIALFVTSFWLIDALTDGKPRPKISNSSLCH